MQEEGRTSPSELAEYRKYLEEADKFQVNNNILVNNEQKKLKYHLSETVGVIDQCLNGALSMSIDGVETQANNLVVMKKKFDREQSSLNMKNKKLIGEIKNLQQKSKALKKELQTVIVETRNSVNDYDGLLSCYSAAFGFSVKVLNCVEGRCQIELTFKDVSDKAVIIIMDAETRNLIDFDASSLCSQEEEKRIKDNYKKHGDLPSLIYDLRNLLISNN